MYTSYPSPNTQQSIFLLRVHELKDLTLQTPSPNSSSLTPQRALIRTQEAFSKLPFILRLLKASLSKTVVQWSTKSENFIDKKERVRTKETRNSAHQRKNLQLHYFIINNHNAVDSLTYGKIHFFILFDIYCEWIVC